MEFNITGRHFTVTDDLKEHLEKKVERFTKYSNRIIDVHAILSEERYLKCAEISIFGKQLKLTETSSKESMHAAIDDVCSRIETALRRYKDKLKSHRDKDSNKLKIDNGDLEEETDENHGFSE